MQRVALFLSVLVLSALPAEGQVQPMEFSVDGGLSIDLLDDTDNLTSFTLPFQQVRFAVGISERASLEGGLQFRYASQGDNSVTAIFIAPAFSYHFQDFEAQVSRPYVTVFGGLSHIDADTGAGSGGDTQIGFGADAGVKLPVAKAGFVRLEAGFSHFVESDDRASLNSISLTVGLGGILN